MKDDDDWNILCDDEERFYCHACGREMPHGATAHGTCDREDCAEMFARTNMFIHNLREFKGVAS